MSPAFGKPGQPQQKNQAEFQVVEEDLTPLLSRVTAEKMNLATANYSNFKQLHAAGKSNCDATKDEYKTVFDESSVERLSDTVNLTRECSVLHEGCQYRYRTNCNKNWKNSWTPR